MRYCYNCGAVADDPRQVYCSSCGGKVDPPNMNTPIQNVPPFQNNVQPAPNRVNVTVAAPPPAPVYRKACSTCGQVINGEALVCPNCGVQLTPNTASAPQNKPSAASRIVGLLLTIIGIPSTLLFLMMLMREIAISHDVGVKVFVFFLTLLCGALTAIGIKNLLGLSSKRKK